jgi:hypothetical protein
MQRVAVAVPMSQLAHRCEVVHLDCRQHAMPHGGVGSTGAHGLDVGRKLRCIKVAMCINPRRHGPMMPAFADNLPDFCHVRGRTRNPRFATGGWKA